MPLACRICIAEKGLHSSEIASLPKTEAELVEHLEREHHVPVRREGETDEQATARLRRDYPDSGDPQTCKCPACAIARAAKAK